MNVRLLCAAVCTGKCNSLLFRLFCIFCNASCGAQADACVRLCCKKELPKAHRTLRETPRLSMETCEKRRLDKAIAQELNTSTD